MSRASMALLLAQRQRASLEAVSTDGVEREYVFFGKMEHPEQLDKAAAWEDQEQWRILVPSETPGREISVRIRKTIEHYKDTDRDGNTVLRGGDIDHTKYLLTIKSFVKGQPGCTEAELGMSKTEGEAMLAIFKAEGDGMIKRRYKFPIDEKHAQILGYDKDVFDAQAIWEVDVFFAQPPSGAAAADDSADYFQPYVKLDLEVRSFEVKVGRDPKDGEYVSFPVPFPIELNDVVYSQPHQRTERDAKRVAEIMDKYMKAKK